MATVLIIEDNPGDVRLTREAFKDARLYINLRVASDGVEAMALLNHEGEFATAARPDRNSESRSRQRPCRSAAPGSREDLEPGQALALEVLQREPSTEQPPVKGIQPGSSNRTWRLVNHLELRRQHGRHHAQRRRHAAFHDELTAIEQGHLPSRTKPCPES